MLLSFKTSGSSHLSETVTAMRLKCMVPSSRLPYTGNYLAPGICSLKSAVMEKLISFLAKWAYHATIHEMIR